MKKVVFCMLLALMFLSMPFVANGQISSLISTTTLSKPPANISTKEPPFTTPKITIEGSASATALKKSSDSWYTGAVNMSAGPGPRWNDAKILFKGSTLRYNGIAAAGYTGKLRGSVLVDLPAEDIAREGNSVYVVQMRIARGGREGMVYIPLSNGETSAGFGDFRGTDKWFSITSWDVIPAGAYLLEAGLEVKAGPDRESSVRLGSGVKIKKIILELEKTISPMPVEPAL